MVKNILVIADLGAAGNLVKNLLFLSDQVDWPLKDDRFERISKQYSSQTTSFNNWLDKEYELRFWHRLYGIDLSDNLDWDQYKKSGNDCGSKPIVFLNHSAFYQLDQFRIFQRHLDIIYICPSTDLGHEWQIRSYCEKKTVEKLHNFSFDSDPISQKVEYIAQHGLEDYYRLNVENMKHIIKARQLEFSQICDSIDLESFIVGDPEIARKKLRDLIKIEIDKQKFTDILVSWRNLHWPVRETKRWKYGSAS